MGRIPRFIGVVFPGLYGLYFQRNSIDSQTRPQAFNGLGLNFSILGIGQHELNLYVSILQQHVMGKPVVEELNGY